MAAKRLGVERHDWNSNDLGSIESPLGADTMGVFFIDFENKISCRSDLMRIDSAREKHCPKIGCSWRTQDDVDVAQTDQ